MHKQILQHIIKVKPVYEQINALPKEFRERVIAKGRIQDKEFVLYVTPLSYRQYKVFSESRYSDRSIVDIFNNHISFPKGSLVNLSYLMKFKLLIKSIIDEIFTISGQTLEDINKDPEILFRQLETYKNSLMTPESIMDMFMANMSVKIGDFSLFKHYESMETMEERMSIVALIELAFGIDLKRRYAISVKHGTPLDLTTDTYTLEKKLRPEAKGSNNELKGIAEETAQILARQIERERKLNTLGIKISSVNTDKENQELFK